MKNSKDPKKDEKIKNIEDKRESEIKELTTEFDNKKREGLNQIKNNYNELSSKVNIDTLAVEELLKRNLEKVIYICY